MKNLFILTGPVHTGKTSRLMQWTAKQKNIDGIFQPVIDEKRFIYHIASRMLKQLEVNNTTDVTIIGEYKFSNQTFNWAQVILNECVSKNLEWLIIDEIGPLELDGKGLEPAVRKIITGRNNFSGKLLCVVRDTILDKFIESYQLANQYELFSF